MENSEDTQPTQIYPPTEPVAAVGKEKKRKPHRWPWVILGIFLVIIAIGLGGWLGYQVAVQNRVKLAQSQAVMVATTQFQLGVNDMENGRLDNARRRFEFVIQADPSFPGVKEKLAEVMLKIAMIKTPTPVIIVTPTIALTPTPDNRGAQDLYNQAVTFVKNKEWENAISTLDALRKVDKTYHAVDADGLYYIALRNRGVDKIVLQGNLEGGIYDLTLSENFGPLDHEADGYRNWARLYMAAASFWEIDWAKVVQMFAQIYPSLPNLRDGSNWTAVERFRVASIGYGDQLISKGEYCAGRDQYKNALSISQDAKLAPTATAAQLLCNPPTPTHRPFTATPRESTPEPTTQENTPVPTESTPVPPTTEPTQATTPGS